MPTYDYQCQACDHSFELYQSITAKPIRKCPSCDALKLVRLIGTGGGVIFKGSGFHETDYRSDQYKKAAETDQKSRQASAPADQSANDNKADSSKPAKEPGKSKSSESNSEK